MSYFALSLGLPVLPYDLTGVARVMSLFALLSLATLSKEQGITIAAVCLLYDIIVIQQVSA